MSFVGDIALAFRALVDEHAGRVRAQVTSAQPLAPAVEARLRAAFEKQSGKTVILEKTEDPAMLGGIIAQLGDMVYDGSVRNQLQAIRSRQTARGLGEPREQCKSGPKRFRRLSVNRFLEGFDEKMTVAETGTVLSVGDGIARVYGLADAMAGEMVEFARRRTRHGVQPRRRHGRHRHPGRPEQIREKARRLSAPDKIDPGAGRRSAARSRRERARSADRRQGPDPGAKHCRRVEIKAPASCRVSP